MCEAMVELGGTCTCTVPVLGNQLQLKRVGSRRKAGLSHPVREAMVELGEACTCADDTHKH